MIDLTTCLQILSLLPPLQFGTPATPPDAPQGTGTLLIAGCRPAEGVSILPGPFEGVAAEDGTVRISAPAQRPNADSYRIVTAAGETKVQGTLGPGEWLSGVCP